MSVAKHTSEYIHEVVFLIWFDDFNIDESLDTWEECARTGTDSDGKPKPGVKWKDDGEEIPER